MEKSNKKFSIYTTAMKYDSETDDYKTVYTLIGETDTISEVDSLYAKAINAELDDIHKYAPAFKSYYTRCAYYTTEECDDNNLHLWYDYGHHTRFIELHFLDRATCDEYLKSIGREAM